MHHRASSIALAIRFLLQLRQQRLLAPLLTRLRVLHHQRVEHHRLQLDLDIVLADEEKMVPAAALGMGGMMGWTSDSGQSLLVAGWEGLGYPRA
ncbi:hypothetical protein B0H13DRAFT_2342996 [Mycena leptocephala]|nr:hypothetical protein B0H13DRAFT_2342996 [Mycena leptocephala]